MKRGRIAALMLAMLVTGLVAGNVVSGWAATAPQAPASESTAPAGCGLQLGGAMREAGARLVDVVARLTGLGTEDVIARRAAGESFEQIADDEGVTADKVVDEALDARKELLDERVKAGSLTAEQAEAALERMDARLTERVTSTEPGCTGAGGRGGMGRGMGGRGAGGGGCAQAPVQ